MDIAKETSNLLLKREVDRLNRLTSEIQLISGISRPLGCKTFCIGSNKTGTTSLDTAMRILGFKSAPEDLAYRYLSFDQSEQIQEKMFRKFLIEESSKFNFFQDLPFCYRDNYKIIDEYFPNCKFILTIRSSNDWFLSCRKWIEKLNCPEIYESIWGMPFTTANEEKIKMMYERRNSRIINYFSSKPNRLLYTEIQDLNFNLLCSFLEIPVPLTGSLGFPHENRNS